MEQVTEQVAVASSSGAAPSLDGFGTHSSRDAHSERLKRLEKIRQARLVAAVEGPPLSPLERAPACPPRDTTGRSAPRHSGATDARSDRLIRLQTLRQARLLIEDEFEGPALSALDPASACPKRHIAGPSAPCVPGTTEARSERLIRLQTLRNARQAAAAARHAAAAAQQAVEAAGVAVRADSVRADSVRADSVRADSVSADSVRPRPPAKRNTARAHVWKAGNESGNESAGRERTNELSAELRPQPSGAEPAEPKALECGTFEAEASEPGSEPIGRSSLQEMAASTEEKTLEEDEVAAMRVSCPPRTPEIRGYSARLSSGLRSSARQSESSRSSRLFEMSISTAGRGGSHILDPPFVEHGDGGDHEYEHLSGRVLRLERDLEEEIRIKSAATLSKLPPIYV